MKLHCTFVALIVAQLVFVVVGSAIAAPKVDVSATNTSSNLKLSAQGDPLQGSGTFKYGKDNYTITITKGYISPDGNNAHLTGNVPVKGTDTPFSLKCNGKTGYVELSFGTVKFWSKGKVTITK